MRATTHFVHQKWEYSLWLFKIHPECYCICYIYWHRSLSIQLYIQSINFNVFVVISKQSIAVGLTGTDIWFNNWWNFLFILIIRFCSLNGRELEIVQSPSLNWLWFPPHQYFHLLNCFSGKLPPYKVSNAAKEKEEDESKRLKTQHLIFFYSVYPRKEIRKKKADIEFKWIKIREK